MRSAALPAAAAGGCCNRSDIRRLGRWHQPQLRGAVAIVTTVPALESMGRLVAGRPAVASRSGTIIRDLRAQSGTNISIADPDPLTPDERVVTITGSPAGIQTAVYLIRQCVESYVPPQQQRSTGGWTGAGAGTANSTLVETLRKQGDAKASVALFDKIVAHEQLIWHCHNGRSQALLARGDAPAALLAANSALELAQVQAAATAKAQEKAEAAEAKKAGAKAGASSSSPSSSASTAAAAAAAASDPDFDPFLSLLPSISFALLHSNRGLVCESFPSPLYTIVGQRAQMEMKRRIERQAAATATASAAANAAATTESKEGVEGKIDAAEEEEAAAQAASMNQRRGTAASSGQQQ